MTTITIDDIRAAARRIHGHAIVTPLLTKSNLNKISGWETLLFKCEALQKTGSFKIRGATNAVKMELENRGGSSSSATTKLTFVCSSSGNHGAALTRAAVSNGCETIIVCPKNAPASKIAAMRDKGAKIVLCEPTQAAREAGVRSVLAENGNAVHVHPYDNPRVWMGQGTVGLEIAQHFAEFIAASGGNLTAAPDVVIVPVGGGGLISGVSVAIRALCPNTLIIGAEPAAADDASRSFKTGKVEQNKIVPPPTIADGLRTTLSEGTLANIRRNVDDIVTVRENEISIAMALIFERLKICIEPSAGVPAAVALFKRREIQAKFPAKELKTAVTILCGGNVDVNKISELAAGDLQAKL